MASDSRRGHQRRLHSHRRRGSRNLHRFDQARLPQQNGAARARHGVGGAACLGPHQRHLDEPEPRALVLSVVEELLPLDDERRLEMEVTVALIAEAPGNDKVREVLDESYEVVREVC